MPDSQTIAPTKAKSNPETENSGAVTTRPARESDGAGANGNGGGPTASSATRTTDIQTATKRRLTLKKIVPVLVLALAGAILLGITGGWNGWVGGSAIQKTDDAILRADITPLSTRVSGTVQSVAVSDYQRVKAGDLLVQLKDDDFKAQVAQAEAGVAAAHAALDNNAKQKELQGAKIMQARAGVEGARADLAQAQAAVEAAKADVAKARAGLDQARAKIPDAQANIE